MPANHVIVIGAGNAALCAAIAARQSGAEVTVLERAPELQSGGNSRFTAGGMRVAYDDVDDLLTVMPDLTADEIENTDFGEYARNQFFDDMCRITEYRCDPDLTTVLVDDSLPTLQWMQQQGVRFMPMYGRQAFGVEGRFKFWGGLTVEAWGGGPGLIDSLYRIARDVGVNIRFNSRAVKLETTNRAISGVRVENAHGDEVLDASAVVLASGGFEANRTWRTRYLGPGWELAKVRGSRFNTGDGIRMAMEVGAQAEGHWSGCHAVGWDRNAPDFGDLAVGDGFQKHSYPLGIMVNAQGQRFVDEGADFRNYTYAKYGQEILKQPGQFAWQIFDSQVTDLLRDEYRIKEVSKVQADTLEDLAARLEGVNAEQFIESVHEFNAAVDTDTPFNPAVKDGRGTRGLAINKSHWANPLNSPPFVAYQITCGITFTFGGIKINTQAEVLNEDGHVIPGLFAAGELVGGLFYFNYPGGTGLTAGAVFGRIAGESAAGHGSQKR